MLYRYLIVFCVISILMSCGSKAEEAKAEAGNKPKPPAATYDAIIVKKFPINRVIQSPGTILPNEMAELHPEVSNRITGIYFKEGALVRKGTLLVKLYDTDLRAQLQKLQVQLRLAKSSQQRQNELLAISGTSKQEVENAELQVSNINADIALLQAELGKTNIYAPFDGRIGLRMYSLGAYVTPGSAITTIAAISQIKIEFDVPELYVTEMQPGKSIAFDIDGSNTKYFATIMASDNSISMSTRSLRVKAVVKNPDAGIKPGAFANVKLNIGNDAPALMVPTQAVIPQTRGKKVVVLRKGLSVFQDVETGYRDSANVEIITGLMDGDTILTSGLLVVKPQQKVKVRVKHTL